MVIYCCNAIPLSVLEEQSLRRTHSIHELETYSRKPQYVTNEKAVDNILALYNAISDPLSSEDIKAMPSLESTDAFIVWQHLKDGRGTGRLENKRDLPTAPTPAEREAMLKWEPECFFEVQRLWKSITEKPKEISEPDAGPLLLYKVKRTSSDTGELLVSLKDRLSDPDKEENLKPLLVSLRGQRTRSDPPNSRSIPLSDDEELIRDVRPTSMLKSCKYVTFDTSIEVIANLTAENELEPTGRYKRALELTSFGSRKSCDKEEDLQESMTDGSKNDREPTASHRTRLGSDFRDTAAGVENPRAGKGSGISTAGSQKTRVKGRVRNTLSRLRII